jgi:hypothetical protein
MDYEMLKTVAAHVLPYVGVLTVAYVIIRLLMSKKPEDEKRNRYIGFAVQAIKWAEKVVPDSTPNRYLKLADESMKIFTNAVTSAEGKEPDAATKAWFLNVKELVILEIDKVKAAKAASAASTAATMAAAEASKK